jgi:hypothetical protein
MLASRFPGEKGFAVDSAAWKNSQIVCARLR